MTLAVKVLVKRGDFELDAAFEAKEGETVALLGPNGSGKSTLVDLVAGILEPDAGRITLGTTVFDDTLEGERLWPEQRPIGVVFQDGLLFPHLSVLENVAFPLRAKRVPARAAKERAREMLRTLGAGDLAAASPGSLSGGQQQRVALARALVAEPKVLLLDEPMSALDVRARADMRSLLQSSLERFPGVRLLITHDPIEAMTMAERLVIIEEGRVTQQGTPAEIREAPKTDYAARLVGLNLFSGRLERETPDNARIVTRDGNVVVAPKEEFTPGTEVLGLLRPADVSLHLERPEGSARNVLHGAVVSVVRDDDRARVRLGTHPAVVAEITSASADRLEVRPGRDVWASFKAVEVRVVPA